MSDEFCKLNQAGMDARNELLDLLGFKKNNSGNFNVKTIKKELNLSIDRATHLACIMRTPAEGVPLIQLKQFFVEIIERISDKYKQERCNDLGKIIDTTLANKLKRQYLISNSNLRKYLTAYKVGNREEKDNWEVPADLYEQILYSRVNNSSRKSPATKLATNRQLDLVNILYNLDYTEQERLFYSILNKPQQCMAFSIAAPCNLTQKWILNRLMTRTINKKNERQLSSSELRPFVINLKTSQVRNNFDDFLQHLSSHFNSDPGRVLDDICQIESDSPLIFVVSEFRTFGQIRKQILQEFWQKINDSISTRSGQTKIIMFWVDECHPCDQSEQIVNLYLLDSLNEIDRIDVQIWLDRHREINCFPEDLTTEKCLNFNWDWKDPWLVLNNICSEFKLRNGVTDIEELWEWKL